MSVNEEILIRFERIQSQERLAHAYLFVGPVQSGKSSTIMALAQMLNCEREGVDRFCGECGSCRKISAGNHPDVLTIEAGVGETIKIEDIRTLIQRGGLRAFEAKWKVFMIRNAERLTKEAANALLKTLEEPNRQTLIFLTTSVPELCLDTIKSRSTRFIFSENRRINWPMSSSRIYRWMKLRRTRLLFLPTEV
jgi:DNA polymerase-3 subunit delta'